MSEPRVYVTNTQKNGAVSKVNKKCIFLTLNGHNIHRQRRQLSTSLVAHEKLGQLPPLTVYVVPV
jgi:hypothetical protein